MGVGCWLLAAGRVTKIGGKEYRPLGRLKVQVPRRPYVGITITFESGGSFGPPHFRGYYLLVACTKYINKMIALQQVLLHT